MTRLRILEPLARRDFALLSVAWTASLLGDGFFHVALAWQVYDLDNSPSAMALVGFTLSASIVVSALIGGLITDRSRPRTVMIWADLIRGSVVAAMAVMSYLGILEVWHVVLMMIPIGFGDMLFNPAAFAAVPALVPAEELPQANAVRSTIRPLMMTLIGPAVGGLVIGLYGPAPGILINAGSFFLSAVAVWFMRRSNEARPPASRGLRQTWEDLTAGLRYAKQTRWLLIALISGTLTIVFFDGPLQVLLPYRVKNDLNAGADQLGLIYAAGGLAAVVTGIVLAQTGIPRRAITAMYWFWGISVLSVAGFGLMTTVWQACAVSIVAEAMLTAAIVIWVTLLQTEVPAELLGRVSSLDWLFSTALSPVSYALTAPAAEAFGAQATLTGAGILGFVIAIALWSLPGARDVQPRRAQMV